MLNKIRNRKSIRKPCPCGGLCECHLPIQENWTPWLFALIPFAVLILVSWWVSTLPSAPHYIEVNGQMCQIQFKQTGITSTGMPVGHDIAVCR